MSRLPRRAALLALLALLSLPAGSAPATDGPVDWLTGYLAFDTTNPPGSEAPAVAYLATILHRRGVATRTFHTLDGRASLYARLDGRRAGEDLLLIHHVDVVPAGDGWSREPFAAETVDGELWGRGAIDVKSLGVAHLAAFLDLAARRGELERGVAFLAVADEENGGERGTGWLFERHPELFDGVAGVLGEGGSAKAVNGRLLWWGVETAQKRPLWLRATARGRAGHASGLNPGSATHDLVAGLASLLELPREWRVSEPVRRYLAALAPLHEGAAADRFEAPDAWVGPDGPRGPMSPGQANLFLDSVQVTMLQAGERINVVPPVAEARIDVRLLPDTDADAFLGRVRSALGEAVEVEVLLAAPPSEPSPDSGPLWEVLVSVLAGEAPVVPSFMPGFTDSRYFRQRGIPTYGLTPFALEPHLLRGIHGVDERMPLDEFELGVERVRRIVAAWALGGE